MPRTKVLAFCILLQLLFLSACLNSEGEYKQLIEEKEYYAESLQSAREENRILLEAQDNIHKERGELQTVLKSYKKSEATEEAGVAALNQELSTDSSIRAEQETSQSIWNGNYYVVQSGDTVSNVATKHQTTADIILKLNPAAKARDGHVIWVGERLKVPSETPRVPDER